jgi:hypothetical protein
MIIYIVLVQNPPLVGLKGKPVKVIEGSVLRSDLKSIMGMSSSLVDSRSPLPWSSYSVANFSKLTKLFGQINQTKGNKKSKILGDKVYFLQKS